MYLKSFEARPRLLDQSGRALNALVRSAAKALGEPVEQELPPGVSGDETSDDRRFLHFSMPSLREGTRVARVFKSLEEAWTNHARVRFCYAGKKAERRVEPYYVLQHSGRYYLLGRDIGARDAGWRYFALDQIEMPIARIGTFTPHEVPERYRGEDALGLDSWSGDAGRERLALAAACSVGNLPRMAARTAHSTKPRRLGDHDLCGERSRRSRPLVPGFRRAGANRSAAERRAAR